MYSHDETVEALSSYLKLLDRVHSGPECLQFPPQGGWPQITKSGFACLGITDETLELLRHVPQWETRCLDFMPRLSLDSYIDPRLVAAWNENSERLRGGEENVPTSRVPPRLVLLGSNQEAEEYYYKVYIDTKHGAVLMEQNAGNIWPELGIPQCKDEVKRDADVLPGPDPWGPDEMEYAYYRIQPFFAACEQKAALARVVPGLRGPQRLSVGG
ncbi:hypothetical protein PG997_002614 [Apiospora hydei]|uniref:Uncharacterized protein n=1 Tax=Apiospora hydei TaxID=1337664 RepID=A0ABR1WWW3_9PEZI